MYGKVIDVGYCVERLEIEEREALEKKYKFKEIGFCRQK